MPLCWWRCCRCGHTFAAPNCVPRAGSSLPAPPPVAIPTETIACLPFSHLTTTLSLVLVRSWWSIARIPCRQMPSSPAIPRLLPANQHPAVSKLCRLVTRPRTRYFLAIFRPPFALLHEPRYRRQRAQALSCRNDNLFVCWRYVSGLGP